MFSYSRSLRSGERKFEGLFDLSCRRYYTLGTMSRNPWPECSQNHSCKNLPVRSVISFSMEDRHIRLQSLRDYFEAPPIEISPVWLPQPPPLPTVPKQNATIPIPCLHPMG